MRSPFLIIALLTAVRGVFGQTPVQPVAGPPQPSRFQQMEITYLDNLRRVHAPLLQQYLAELKVLLDKSPAADAAAIKAEVARVQKMIAETGLIEFSNSKAPVVTDKPAGANGIVFTLEPHEAVPPQPDDKPVPVGKASWTLSRLPAGNYDVIAHYSCEKLGTSPVLNVAFQDQKFQRELKPSNVTKDSSTFRVMRLCQLKLKEDATFQALSVDMATGEAPWFFVKQILIVKAKEPK